ncbi:hypothetical protein BHE74_00036257 [Ensete ventricosum]|nr:hypothetical protein BHE74_00036257 [Ensete ventricosum]
MCYPLPLLLYCLVAPPTYSSIAVAAFFSSSAASSSLCHKHLCRSSTHLSPAAAATPCRTLFLPTSYYHLCYLHLPSPASPPLLLPTVGSSTTQLPATSVSPLLFIVANHTCQLPLLVASVPATALLQHRLPLVGPHYASNPFVFPISPIVVATPNADVLATSPRRPSLSFLGHTQPLLATLIIATQPLPPLHQPQPHPPLQQSLPAYCHLLICHSQPSF